MNFDKIRIFHKDLGSLCDAKRKLVKKFTEANFSNLVTYLFYTYLKKSTEKIMSEIYFVGKTRYEDLTETGS